MWAAQRRMVILFVIFAIIAFFVILPYWLGHRVPPTCGDGKMNQDELGVDCGGTCTLVCPNTAKDINILWTKVFPVRPGMYDVVAYVENANFTFGAPSLPYTVKLFDASGAVIAEEAGATYALPNERFVIFRGNIGTGEKVAASGGIEIPNTFPWFTEPRVEQKFSVEDKILTSPDRSPKLTAVLKNENPEVYRDIDATAIIYDSKNSPIAVSSTHIDKLEKSGSEKLFFTWPAPLNYVSETEECLVPVDAVLLVDRSGSMASESKDPPQPFTRVRDATASFVDFLSMRDQVGLVSFATAASNPLDLPLTNDFDRAKRKIETIAMGTDGIQYTNTSDALFRAATELGTLRARDDAKKIVVLLTDGEALEPNRPQKEGDPDYAKNLAFEAAEKLKRGDVAIYTIGLGINANDEFLKQVATTPDHYYAAPSVADLRGVYKQIATSICKKAPSVIEIIPRVNMAQ